MRKQSLVRHSLSIDTHGRAHTVIIAHTVKPHACSSPGSSVNNVMNFIGNHIRALVDLGLRTRISNNGGLILRLGKQATESAALAPESQRLALSVARGRPHES